MLKSFCLRYSSHSKYTVSSRDLHTLPPSTWALSAGTRHFCSNSICEIWFLTLFSSGLLPWLTPVQCSTNKVTKLGFILGPGSRKEGHRWLDEMWEGFGDGIRNDGISKEHSIGFPVGTAFDMTSAFLSRNRSLTSVSPLARSFNVLFLFFLLTICGGRPAGIDWLWLTRPTTGGLTSTIAARGGCTSIGTHASGSVAGSTTLTFCATGTAEFRLWEKTGDVLRALRMSSGLDPGREKMVRGSVIDIPNEQNFNTNIHTQQNITWHYMVVIIQWY